MKKKNFLKNIAVILISLVVIFTIVKAGTITPPSGTPEAQFYSLSEIYEFITNNTAATEGSPALDWSSALEGTGNTLSEIYASLSGLIVEDEVFTGTTYLGVTGTLKLACATSSFDGTDNLVSDSYDGDGDGTNRWCITDSGDAAVDRIVSGSFAWVDGVEIIGTFASQSKTATLEGQEVEPDSGYWLSKVTVAITNLIDSVIQKDEVVGGVTGTLVPSGGTATAGQVASGSTFFGASQTNWTLQIGTFDPWTPQSLIKYDDYKDTSGTTGEETAEEATWTETSGNMDGDCMDANDVCQDGRTGLYWSDKWSLTASNSFTLVDCAFFASDPRGSYDGTDPDCGSIGDGGDRLSAINYCATLELDSNNDAIVETDWYLPSQKELMQAYIDGTENNIVNATPGSPYGYWSSTEKSSNSSYAWRVTLYLGYVGTSTKDTLYWVRCVRRD